MQVSAMECRANGGWHSWHAYRESLCGKVFQLFRCITQCIPEEGCCR